MCRELLPAGPRWRARVIAVTFQGPSHSIRMVINHGGNSVADWKHHLGAARGALPGTCQGGKGGKRRHGDGSAAPRTVQGIWDGLAVTREQELDSQAARCLQSWGATNRCGRSASGPLNFSKVSQVGSSIRLKKNYCQNQLATHQFLPLYLTRFLFISFN